MKSALHCVTLLLDQPWYNWLFLNLLTCLSDTFALKAWIREFCIKYVLMTMDIVLTILISWEI